MAELISPRRMERIVDENGFPTLRFIEYLEGNTINDSNRGTSIDDLQSQIDDLQSQLDDVVFTESFTSSEQTISTGGLLTLPHGLSSIPHLVVSYLICKTAELGYSIGDEVSTALSEQSSAGSINYGLSMVPDDTNLNVRYAGVSDVFIVNNKTTGAGATITPANWKLIIRAWA